MWLVICFIKKARQKTLRSGEFFVVVIITKGMRVKCTPESDSGVLLYEGGIVVAYQLSDI